MKKLPGHSRHKADSAKDARARRLAAALRQNIARRKAQQQGRSGRAHPQAQTNDKD